MSETTREYYVSLQDATTILNVSPQTFRQLISDYQNYVKILGDGKNKGLSEEGFRNLQMIVSLREQGLATEEIAASLEQQYSVESVEMADLFAEIKELREALVKSQERYLEDREKMMLTLLKLQKEIQHLRYELASTSSRKERKKKLWRG